MSRLAALGLALALEHVQQPTQVGVGTKLLQEVLVGLDPVCLADGVRMPLEQAAIKINSVIRVDQCLLHLLVGERYSIHWDFLPLLNISSWAADCKASITKLIRTGDELWSNKEVSFMDRTKHRNGHATLGR